MREGSNIVTFVLTEALGTIPENALQIYGISRSLSQRPFFHFKTLKQNTSPTDTLCNMTVTALESSAFI